MNAEHDNEPPIFCMMTSNESTTRGAVIIIARMLSVAKMSSSPLVANCRQRTINNLIRSKTHTHTHTHTHLLNDWIFGRRNVEKCSIALLK
jgi:hypothetical protein